jgi:hypothetical protein
MYCRRQSELLYTKNYRRYPSETLGIHKTVFLLTTDADVGSRSNFILQAPSPEADKGATLMHSARRVLVTYPSVSK